MVPVRGCNDHRVDLVIGNELLWCFIPASTKLLCNSFCLRPRVRRTDQLRSWMNRQYLGMGAPHHTQSDDTNADRLEVGSHSHPYRCLVRHRCGDGTLTP